MLAQRKPALVLKRNDSAPLESYALATCYGHDAPRLLVAMWCALIRAGGLFQEGIFRLAPDNTQAERTTV